MHVWTFGSAAALAAARSRKNDRTRPAGAENACGARLGTVSDPAPFDRSAIVQPDAFVDPELVMVAPSSRGATPHSPTRATRTRQAWGFIVFMFLDVTDRRASSLRQSAVRRACTHLTSLLD